jgi:hypothetical protein
MSEIKANPKPLYVTGYFAYLPSISGEEPPFTDLVHSYIRAFEGGTNSKSEASISGAGVPEARGSTAKAPDKVFK